MDLTNGKKPGKGKRKEIDLSTLVYGKVPPQAREIEENVLGAIIIEGGKPFDEVSRHITNAEVFYVDAHQRIFRAMQELNKAGRKIDQLTVGEQLQKSEELDLVGGPYFITKLTNSVSSSAHVEDWCYYLLEKFLRRAIIETGGRMVHDAYEDSGDGLEILDKAEMALFALANALQKRDVEPIDALLVRAIQQMEKKREQYQKDETYISGIPSGYRALDKLTHGWQPTDLIILAARPSVGKTAFALNLARNAALSPKKIPVAVFSLEMSSSQLINRILSAESEIPLEKISKGILEEHEMETLYRKGIQKLAEAKLFIDDTPALNVFELRAKCRRLKNSDNIGLIIIDYLQLMSGTDSNKNREQEISTISRSLKALAKELEVPIIALSQLSREVERRGENNKMPQLSDLRESGAIEQDADVVCFMYRPEYHGIHKTNSGENTVGLTELKFAKHRNGTLDVLKFRAQLWIQKFIEGWDELQPKSPIYGGNGLDKPNFVYSIGSNGNGHSQIEDDLNF